MSIKEALEASSALGSICFRKLINEKKIRRYELAICNPSIWKKFDSVETIDV